MRKVLYNITTNLKMLLLYNVVGTRNERKKQQSKKKKKKLFTYVETKTGAVYVVCLVG